MNGRACGRRRTDRVAALLGREEGSAVAEVAVLMPTLLVILALSLTGVRVAAVQLLAQDAAADAARSAGRGDPPGYTAGRVARAVPNASFVRSRNGDLVCASVSAPAALGLRVSASSCAWDGGR